MNHMIPSSQIQTTRFVPFEDILGVSHDKGISSLIVPGAGEANYDSYELNPYESSKQRQESEVRGLMNKLAPDMITLDPNVIGTVDKRQQQDRLTPAAVKELELKTKKDKDDSKDLKKLIKPESKGKNSALRKLKRKQRKNVITERAQRIESVLKKERELRKEKAEFAKGVTKKKDVISDTLSRFS
ncbi:unnamed protein product [Ambrosiozyma monospora]|uniref:Unnamed protein product n=1 Tax=Ambrosiozyma monospora TaxID=43982 RepID=A0ACB5T3I0_AMBMO|nr:unnamed protein product [Ambrosiozyma monospora]